MTVVAHHLCGVNKCVTSSKAFYMARSKNPSQKVQEPPKKPYAPPAIEESGSFERLVLTCTHLPTGMGNCHPAAVRS